MNIAPLDYVENNTRISAQALTLQTTNAELKSEAINAYIRTAEDTINAQKTLILTQRTTILVLAVAVGLMLCKILHL